MADTHANPAPAMQRTELLLDRIPGYQALTWASATDTVLVHEDQNAARVYEFVASILCRWPGGPWIDADTGRPWHPTGT